MAELRLYFFGAPRIERDGRPLPLRRTRALALLAYLALGGQPQERERLLGLLWPEFDPDSARNNLRRELSLLKTVVGDAALSADRLQVAWSGGPGVWVDVAAFEAQLAAVGLDGRDPGELDEVAAAALAEAAQLYGDDLMAGFSLADCPAFDEWLFFQREGLRQRLARALPALSEWHGGRGAYDLALGYARRWLALDPLHEPAQRELMRLYALAGQHSAALRQYDECSRLLEAELGAAPEAATAALYEAIRARRLGPPPEPEPWPAPAAAPPAPAPRPPLNNLPAPAPGFVGRERESADLVRRLTDPDCRLLTLVGPGGIGKTQLALHVARLVAEGWAGDEAIADGVLFVPLVALGSTDEIVSALAAAARFDFYPNIPPAQQLIDYLRGRRLLVVLDNFEHLREAVGLVADLLAAAPGLRLLVTSREALNLQEEWFHPLEGLSYPGEEEAAAGVARLARFDAVRVFEQHARRFQGGFSLSREREHVVRLCRLVAGTPLAIELAASWLKVLTVEQIVAALERGLDILTARSRDVPARHRSMRSVLEETWRLLNPAEQRALASLSVFSGSFTVAAAEAVAGVTLPGLASLVERSLLRAASDGRFELHELLRQFAAEQLGADPAAAQGAHERHSAFYLEALAQHDGELAGPTLQGAVAAVAREAENIRAAWQWACRHGRLARLDGALGAYYGFLIARSAFQEGREQFAQALAAAECPPEPADGALCERVEARAAVRWGAMCHHLGDHATAAVALERGLAGARRHSLQHEVGFALLLQGVAAGARGEVALARGRLGETLAIGRAGGASPMVADALYELANIAGHYGEFAEGTRLARASVAAAREAGAPDRTAYALVQLAWLSACRGDYDEAERDWGEALGLFEQIGNRYGVALGLGGAGYVAWCVGGARLAEAEALTRRSLAILRAINHRLSIASRLSDLAVIALDRGDHRLAEACGQEGLALARQVNSAVYTASHLAILGHLAAAAGDFAQGRRLLGEALSATAASNLLPRLAFACYQIAALAAAEAAALGPDHPLAAGRRADALALLAAIAGHDAAMHVHRSRARLLAASLRRELPPALADAALERGRRLDLRAGGAALLAAGA